MLNEKNRNENNLQPKLLTRHISMIALGGSIGTGLFVASGATVAQAGPIGALLAYALIGVMVYFLMTSLGEMATYLPTSGAFAEYGARFVDPAFGFALGWNYWLNWAVTIAVDSATIGVVMRYWFPHTSLWPWSLGAFLLVLLVNLLSVRAFGETEYWIAVIKVVTIIIFLAVGTLTIFGVMNGNAGLNVQDNLLAGNSGFVGGISGLLSVFVIAGFSFQGTELLGVTAGESKNPEESIPKATNQIFWRILLFYIFAIFIIGALINYKDPSLVNSAADNIAASPFTTVFNRAGFALAAAVMNAVILTSVISAANSGMYASSRMLYALAEKNQAPKFLASVAKSGVPVNSLLVTAIVAVLVYVVSIFGEQAYLALVNASGLIGFIAWLGIAISHFRFRRAFAAQGHQLSELKYRAKLFPLGPIVAIIMTTLVIIGQIIYVKSLLDFIIIFAAIPVFAILYFGYKIRHHTKLLTLKEVNLKQ